MGDYATPFLALFDHGLHFISVGLPFLDECYSNYNTNIYSLENAATILLKIKLQNKNKRRFCLDTPQHSVIKRAYSKTFLTLNVQEGLPPLTCCIVYNQHDLSSTFNSMVPVTA